MLSPQHELILMLFSTPLALLMQSLGEALSVKMPSYREARTDSADLTDIQPAEYRADLVVTLVGNDGAPVMGVIVEVQLARDSNKRFTWPVYAVNLRARLRCPVCLMVVTLNESVARWAGQPIELGTNGTFLPLVLGPSQIAKVTDAEQACRLPELAVLSAMAHGEGVDTATAVKIANAAWVACKGLGAKKARLYADVVYASLSEAARREVKMIDLNKWEYMSDWARGYVAQGREEGREEGRVEGRAEIIRQLLSARFGAIPPEVETQISLASPTELGEIGVRILTATTLGQVFDKH
jgi:hypothetical protein